MTLTALPWMVAHADSSCTALAISPSSPARRSCACSGKLCLPQPAAGILRCQDRFGCRIAAVILLIVLLIICQQWLHKLSAVAALLLVCQAACERSSRDMSSK